MTFDPSEHEKPKGTRSSYKTLDKPGTYMLGISKAHEHNETKNGKLYTRFRFVVLDGEEKGASFFDSVFRNPEAHKRLAALCYAVRNTNKFDPMSDSAMERQFVGRAFMCDVKTERGNDGNDYARASWPLTDYSEQELATMREWERRFAQRAQEMGSRGGSQSESRGGGRSSGRTNPRDFDDSGDDWGSTSGSATIAGGDFGDDDIPF